MQKDKISMNIEIPGTHPTETSKKDQQTPPGLSMNQSLEILASTFEDSLNTVKSTVNTQILQLFVPLILLELVIYILMIVIGFLVVRSRWQKQGASIAVELLLVIPTLFAYLNWTLFEELYDKKHKIVRLESILKRIYEIRDKSSAEQWDDFNVEFEEGQVDYAFVYRDQQWQRWPNLLLVEGDIACFPTSTSSTSGWSKQSPTSAMGATPTSMNSPTLSGSIPQSINMTAIGQSSKSRIPYSDFLQYENISDFFLIDETPIRAFVNNCCGMDDNKSRSYFWNRIKRLLRCDLTHRNNPLSSSFVSSSSADSNNTAEMNELNNAEHVLNYSVYRTLYHTSYSWMTCITWIAVLVILFLRMTRFDVLDMRYGLVIFFVFPFSVAILEALYQSFYIWRVIGFWKFSTTKESNSPPTIQEIWDSFVVYYHNPMD